MATKPIPDGFHAVTPYLVVKDAAQLIDFVKAVFDAAEVERMVDPSGRTSHAEVKIGDSMIMLSQATEKFPATTAMLYVYVPDCDATYRRAMAAGGRSLMDPADQFYGDRNAGIADTNGIQWWIATHVEDVAPEELARRAKAAGK